MARIGSALSPRNSEPARWCRIVTPVLLALALPGCEALERMDYLDRFFEPGLGQRSVAAVERGPDPAAPAPATGWNHQSGSVVAMEPRPDPFPSPAADWDPNAGGTVVAMEPRPNPPAPSAAAVAGSAQPSRARAAPPPVAAATPTAPQAEAEESRTRLLVRQNPWLTRFWMELTPAQQGRVERQLHRSDVVLAAEKAEPAAAWDAMGLADRAKLVFGAGGQPPERPAPPERRDGSTWARTS